MKELSASAQAALASGQIVPRDFLWLTVRDRSTGNPFSQGFWSGIGAVTADVINPITRATENRAFVGAGGLISVSAVPSISSLTVQQITVQMSQIGAPETLLQNYHARQGGVQIFRGLFAVGGAVQLDPAFPRFNGLIDTVEMVTPSENENGSMILRCVSQAQQMIRFNPATRSDAYQRLRSGNDSLRRHVATVGTWTLNWGNRAR